MRRQVQKRIPLKRFGAVTGLIFEDGGAAEVVMTFPEVSRIVNAWQEHEAAKKKPDPKTMAALDVLASKVYKFDAKLVAEVPIAVHRATITPVIPQK